MNVVEIRHGLENNQTTTPLFHNITNGNNSIGSNDTISNFTTELPTTIPSSTELPNMTVIDTMVKTVLTMQNITSVYEPINHDYYIYIWAIAILGCIILTTGR